MRGSEKSGSNLTGEEDQGESSVIHWTNGNFPYQTVAIHLKQINEQQQVILTKLCKILKGYTDFCVATEQKLFYSFYTLCFEQLLF